jgi:hypothetical protein
MTEQQKLTIAIHREIAENSMRELALNSLRFKVWSDFVGASDNARKRLDELIIASIPDDTQA